jgi:hypothetical protein
MYVVGCNVEVILLDTGTNLIVGSCGISICLGDKSLMRKEVWKLWMMGTGAMDWAAAASVICRDT